MRIAQVLRGKGDAVWTVSPGTPVGELVAILTERGVGALVVSDDGTTVDGIVSERDVVRRLGALGGDLLARPVREIMTTAVHTCTPADTLEHLMVLMTEQRVRHVPVVDAGRLAGIVSIGDVVKQRMAELQSERDQLSAYIST